MTRPTKRALANAVLDVYGGSFADELGIAVEKNTPAPLFQLLCAALLYSARISANNASRAMKALLEAGLTTPRAMARASWQDRVNVITEHYKRYDERTSTMLGETAALVVDRYRGDLRNLREEAEKDVDREKRLLTEFKGVGAVGADIFLREVQIAWPEVYPFADERVLAGARKLGLGKSARELSQLVSRRRYPSLTAALVRVGRAKAYEEVRRAARE